MADLAATTGLVWKSSFKADVELAVKISTAITLAWATSQDEVRNTQHRRFLGPLYDRLQSGLRVRYLRTMNPDVWFSAQLITVFLEAVGIDDNDAMVESARMWHDFQRYRRHGVELHWNISGSWSLRVPEELLDTLDPEMRLKMTPEVDKRQPTVVT